MNEPATPFFRQALSLRGLFTLWALLQLGRVIAWPLVQSAWNGSDPAAWLFPALIDLVVASGVPAAIWCAWKGLSLGRWLFLMLWLGLSIFDHASACTAFMVAGVPSIFKGYGESGISAPLIQAAFDVVFMAGFYRMFARSIAYRG